MESEPQNAVPKPKLRWFRSSLRTLLLLTLLSAIVLKAGLEWQRRQRMEIAQKWAQACLDQEYPDCGRDGSATSPGRPCQRARAPLDETLRPIILKMAVTRSKSPRERIAGLRILMESSPATALAMLREALRDERDPQVKAVELRLVGLYRDATAADMVFHSWTTPTLRFARRRRCPGTDPLPGVRHIPVYPRLLRAYHDAFASDPPIDTDSLFEWVIDQGKPPPVRNISECLPMNVIELPAAMRAALETMMLDAPAVKSGWPPPGAAAPGHPPTTGSAWPSGACGSTMAAS